jgi:alpha-1,3-rhamnosyl/mannosyltransferase
VRHLGYLPDRNLPALYNGARALVYPSFYEGFGLPCVEMLACGGAVLASDADVFQEVLQDHAHRTAAADVHGWTAALARSIEEPDFLSSLRQGAVDFARRYSWDNAARETVRVYRSIHESAREVTRFVDHSPRETAFVGRRAA